MAAIDRWDEWEAGVDASLADDAPALDEIYPPEVLAAIDQRVEPAQPSTGVQRRVAGGALVLGLVNGVREAVDPDDDDDAIVELLEAERGRRLEPVTVHLAWGDPAASVAIVRPWLFPIG